MARKNVKGKDKKKSKKKQSKKHPTTITEMAYEEFRRYKKRTGLG